MEIKKYAYQLELKYIHWQPIKKNELELLI